MLNHLVAARYTSGSPPLVVLSDSLLQPGRSLFDQLISSAPASTYTVLVSAEQAPTRAVPSRLDPGRVELIDCTVDRDFPQPSSSSFPSPAASIDLAEPQAQQNLEQAVIAAAQKARSEVGPVQIAIDGINALAEPLGTQGVWRLVKKGLRALEGLPHGSRILLLHHDHFPSLPGASSTADSISSPALLASLLSPLLSPSTIHLALHSTSHFHVLSNRFSLTLPNTTDLLETLDLRTTEFLARLRERGVGDPFRRPERSDEDDERIALDALASGDGRAVLGWNCRGVTVGKVSRIASGGVGSAAGAGEKKVVTWGLEGLRRKSDDLFDVEEVELGSVLDPKKMAKMRDDVSSSTPIMSPNPTSSASARPTPAPSSGASTASTPLPFSLSLTPSQLAARALVANPYEGSNKPIFGEAGYTGQMDERPGSRNGGGGGGLRVEYTADRGDDLDEEEPDEDLEI